MVNTPNTILPDWLARCAENFPTHLAVKCGAISWTFAELNQQANHLAGQLAAAGVREGQRVALLATNGLSYVVFVHALMRLGAILVPLNTRLTLEELCWQLNDVKATLLVSDENHASTAALISHSLPQLPQAHLITDAHSGNAGLQGFDTIVAPLLTQIDLNAIQAILYTSGTTGKPKGVLITYGMQWWNAIGSALNLGHHPDDCWLACMPFFHIGGLSILIRSVIYGISVIVLEKFEPTAVNQAIHEDKVTLISVVAVMLQRMITTLDADDHDGYYLSTLRCVLLGGGPAPRSLLEDCARHTIPVVQTYGLTESCSQAVTLSPIDALRKPGSAGRPLLPVQLRIMNEDRPANPGEPGIICLKGPTITPGYADRPEATLTVFNDGWLTTGDIGYLDKDGYLYVLDRRSDLIISGGENIYPAELEAVLLAHPDVDEAGVCGQDDPQWGQIPIAFIRLRSGSTLTIDALQAYAAQHLARYKQPGAYYFVPQLPRNSSGKLIRRELPRLLSSG